MLDINQEVLCDYCERNKEVDRNRCEGSRCDEARADYVCDHGLVYTEGTFGDLRIGDSLYVVTRANKPELYKRPITKIEACSDKDKMTIGIMGLLSVAVNRRDKKSNTESVFINKKEAVEEYKKRIMGMVEAMMTTIMELE